jgi:hypothetical protein
MVRIRLVLATGRGGDSPVTMRERISKLAHPSVLLLVVAILAYGLLLPQMGFYWDELPMSWIRYELGPEAMTRYFSTNRPVWGMLYQITTRFLPQVPIYWEVFGLFWRWVAAVLVWRISRNLWRGHDRFAFAAAAAFLVYPGFNQQWTSYLYSHFLIVLCFLLQSFLLTIWSLQHRRWYLPLTAAALVLSGLNLLAADWTGTDAVDPVSDDVCGQRALAIVRVQQSGLSADAPPGAEG